MKSPPDPLAAIYARTRGLRLRFTDSHDARAFLYRSAEKLAAREDSDFDHLAVVLLAIADACNPPAFEAVLGIPREWRGTDISRRDDFLRRAARELDVQPGRSLRVALHQAWTEYALRLHPVWRDDAEPPSSCSHLHYLLWAATKASGGRVLSARQLGNIL